MLSQTEKVRASRRIATPQSTAAPLLGWNTRDPFEAMEPTDAVLLDNWYPDFGGVSVRKGTQPYANGLGTTAVETLTVFNSNINPQFLGACDGSIYNITTAGTVGTAIQSGFTSNRWQTAMFNGHLFLANGADKVQIYNGTTMADAGFTGVTLTTLNGVGVFHNRLFFWTGGDPSFWYGPPNGITGLLTNFDLSTVQTAGGNLITVEVFSYDGGTGIDSYTCFFMSSGELLMYSGSDPSNINNWALVGRYMISPPVAIRAIVRYGGDIYLATNTDHQQLSKILIALKLGETPPRTKIAGAATRAHAAAGDIFGWQAIYYPAGSRLIFNIPNTDGSFSQHIYNTSVQGWTRFTGMPSSCWCVFKDMLYYGSSVGRVIQADIGAVDGLNSIVSISQQAWQNFGSPLLKRLTASRIVVQTTNQGASYDFRVAFDYRDSVILTPIGLPPQASLWGSSIWDNFLWASSRAFVDMNWHIEGGEGSSLSWGIMANTKAPMTWVRTDLMLEPGNML
jgi:hypothetical protein